MWVIIHDHVFNKVVENSALWTKYGNDSLRKKWVFSCSEFFKALVTYWQFYPSRWLKQAGSEIHTRWITQAASETHTYLGRRTHLKGGAKFVSRSGELRSRRGSGDQRDGWLWRCVYAQGCGRAARSHQSSEPCHSAAAETGKQELRFVCFVWPQESWLYNLSLWPLLGTRDGVFSMWIGLQSRVRLTCWSIPNSQSCSFVATFCDHVPNVDAENIMITKP